MMKRVLAVIVLGVAALVAYNFVTTGKLALIPTARLTEQEKEIDDLVRQARETAASYLQAGRAAGLSGVDTTADAAVAREKIEAIQKRARELQKKATEETKAGLERLQHAIDQAKKDMGIR
jgi:hypothetical protein